MSSSTPNIGLTLPIGTEKVSRAIINQNMTKIDAAFGNMPHATMRPVPFDVAVSDWSGSGSSWTATFVTAFVTSTSQEILTYTSSIKTAKAEDLDATKQPGGGGIVFTSTKKPIGTISGTIYVWDTDDGKIPVIIEGTVTPIENGGTNASNLTGAKQNLGISALETNVQDLSDHIATIITGEFHELIPYSSDIAFGNDNYSTSGYIVRGGMCWVNISMTIANAQGDSSKIVCTGFPASLKNTIKPPAWSSFGLNDNRRAESLFQSNTLYIRNAVAGQWAISFCYPVANS